MNALSSASTKAIAFVPDDFELPKIIMLKNLEVDKVLFVGKIVTKFNASLSVFLGLLSAPIGVASFSALCFNNTRLKLEQCGRAQKYLEGADSLVVYTTEKIAREFFTKKRVHSAGMMEDGPSHFIRLENDKTLVILAFKRVDRIHKSSRCRLLGQLSAF